ncbi:MAG: hypothetical protein WCJ29_00415 [bacterium]
MPERLKTILSAIVILLTACVLGFLIWYFFFKAPLPSPTVPTVPVGPGQFPVGGEGAPVAVTPRPPESLVGALEPLPTFAPGAQGATQIMTENPAQNLIVSGNTASFYDPNNGTFSKLDANGNIVKLSDKTFFDVNKVTWAPSAEKAILEFPDKSKVIYDFKTEKQITLPKHWEDFGFSPDGNKIIGKSIGQDVESRWLFVSNSDGSQNQAIQELGVNAGKVDVSWSPGNQVVAFARTGQPRDGESQEIIPLGLNHENFKSMIVPGFGFDPKWSPDGSTLLYSVYNTASGYRPELYIATGGTNTLGENRQFLKLQTWANKCSYQSATIIYCAVPTSLEAGVGIVPEAADNTNDSIYRINTATGVQELVVPPASQTISQISASADGRTLYYTDTQTGRLNKVSM